LPQTLAGPEQSTLHSTYVGVYDRRYLSQRQVFIFEKNEGFTLERRKPADCIFNLRRQLIIKHSAYRFVTIRAAWLLRQIVNRRRASEIMELL
jgi:hypothetical protein